MIRVLHASDPGEARRRLAFLGVSPPDIDGLCLDLRPYLMSVLDGEKARRLSPWLFRLGIPSAWGKKELLFSASSRDQVDRWMRELPEARDALRPVAEAIGRYLSREFILVCRGRELKLGGVPRIMGVLNITPDSFSDGGRYGSTEEAVERGLGLVSEGADIVDVGGESTRPGSHPLPAEEEMARVIPVIRGLSKNTDAILSVDTTKSVVAREAVSAGVRLINDTSALKDDPQMAEVVRESGCAVALMHRRGTPATMQHSPAYESLFGEILEELSDRVDGAERAGIPGDRILVDPGVGFGKRFEDNLSLHRHLFDLRNLGKPVLFGPSRKAFLGKITGKEPGMRIFGTAASVALACLGGADIVRVHDVKEMREIVQVVSAVRGGAEC